MTTRAKASERKGVPRSLSQVRGETPSTTAGYRQPTPGQKTVSQAKDAEQLTLRQRVFLETLVDFRHTLYECARIAGYSNPERAVSQLWENPFLVRAILRRFHRRLVQFTKVFGPMPKFVKDVPKPKKGAHIRTGQGNEKEGFRVPVAEGVFVESILGEGKR